jgi:group I intron endonuclease
MSLDLQLAWPCEMPEMGIYEIRCTFTGQVYVGQSRRLRGRWRDHLKELRAGRGCPRLQKVWGQHGEASLTFRVLEVVMEGGLLTEREQHYIDALDACGPHGLNTLPRAGRFEGYTPDAEARAKIGAASRKRLQENPGHQPSMVVASKACGYTPSVKHRQRISQAQKGVSKGPMSEQQKQAISKAKAGRAPLAAIAAKTGSKLSAEVKQKIGDANRRALTGRPWSEARRAAYEQARRQEKTR